MLSFEEPRRRVVGAGVDVCFGERMGLVSGSDVSVMVKDVLMEPVRLTQDACFFKRCEHPDGGEGWVPCSPSDPEAVEKDLDAFAADGTADRVVVPKISRRDFEKVLTRARPTVSPEDLEEFKKFASEFGEEG